MKSSADLFRGPVTYSRASYTPDTDEGRLPHLRNESFESYEMKKLVALGADLEVEVAFDHYQYNSAQVFPDWCLKNVNWKHTVVCEQAHSVSDILKMVKSSRSSEQNNIVIKWLMGAWKIAFTMGYKRCGDMLRSFEYLCYQPGDYIIKEGERGLSFYIIVSGDTEVHKNGIG
eukprot:CAMPEP_0173257372 /NCGR_PEP_ID=MMETSP1142-20121109/23731_1 /TAXON_ID=483371 /ORGANISM="non described non described, Strain CCMP2298" /LENGTH=172 /DNA_ID=CAMNT_0014191489 /DNA_START=187 /DNA_END=702 /DNA_ORIENTATION=-